MNYSFGLLKPDCVERGLQKVIFQILFLNNLIPIIAKQIRLTQEQINIIYKSYLPEGAFNNLSKIFLAGDCIIYIVKGINAISRLNGLVGYNIPEQALPRTIRHQFGQSIARNVIHSTDNRRTFWKEVRPFLSPFEMKRLHLGCVI
ncbi:MAG: nucleoside-diphosphate kinase [Patescibacteria group bacterium]